MRIIKVINNYMNILKMKYFQKKKNGLKALMTYNKQLIILKFVLVAFILLVQIKKLFYKKKMKT